MKVYTRGVSKSVTIVDDIASTLSCTAQDIADQIVNYSAYDMVSCDVMGAMEFKSNHDQILSVPVNIDGTISTVYVVLETKEDSLHITAIGRLPAQLLKESADIISELLIESKTRISS